MDDYINENNNSYNQEQSNQQQAQQTYQQPQQVQQPAAVQSEEISHNKVNLDVDEELEKEYLNTLPKEEDRIIH